MTINNNVIRILNDNFVPAGTTGSASYVTYSLRWSYPTNISNTLSGRAFLESSLDGIVWESISYIELGLKVSLSITLGLEITETILLSGYIKPGHVVRIRTEGIIPFLVGSQEVILNQ